MVEEEDEFSDDEENDPDLSNQNHQPVEEEVEPSSVSIFIA